MKIKMSKPLIFDQSIEKLGVLFRFSGMNIKNKIVTPLDTIKYRWLYTLNFLVVFSAIIGSVYYVILGIKQGKNFIEVTSVAPCLTFSILSMIKSLYHLMYEEHIQELIDLLTEHEIRENNREKCIEKEEIIANETGFLNKVINVLYVLNCSMIVVFDMTPIVMIAVKYYKTNEFEMLLPYLDVFSFIPYELKYWPFAYIHQIWSECVVLLDMAAADYLFFTCCTYIRVQFKLLQYDFERMIPDRSISKGLFFEENELRNKFTELLKWHQDIIYSSTILEIIYSKSTLFNFLSSSLVICLTGFNVTIVDDIVIIITFLTFLSMALMQVFFLCFFADLMMTASLEITNSVYNCKWYSANIKVGKQILFVQTRAQEPCKLTAAGFADVNLNAFMRVLSSAWSYFALLRTVYGAK
uniref:Odorant receptor n=1 Tax=Helicoverpa armigera TaxID=29058 RepID=R4JUT8_HELAM|nr:olfactory receptor 7 [Helicoverpa armigera]